MERRLTLRKPDHSLQRWIDIHHQVGSDRTEPKGRLSGHLSKRLGQLVQSPHQQSSIRDVHPELLSSAKPSAPHLQLRDHFTNRCKHPHFPQLFQQVCPFTQPTRLVAHQDLEDHLHRACGPRSEDFHLQGFRQSLHQHSLCPLFQPQPRLLLTCHRQPRH